MDLSLREGAMIDNMAQFSNKSLLANEDSITAKDIESVCQQNKTERAS